MNSPLRCESGHSWAISTSDSQATTGALSCPTCGGAPTLEALGAPAGVAAAVRSLRDELQRTAGPNLAGLVLYGGLARGRFRPSQSDVNVALLLHDASVSALAVVAPALERAWRTAAVVPLLLTPADVAPLAELFPSKFLDIRDHHVVLAGTDSFVGLAVPRERLRIRVEQALSNHLLRLRRRYMGTIGQPVEQKAILVEVARPLALELAALLSLAGKSVPAEDRTAAIFSSAAAAFDLDAAALAELDALRHGREPTTDQPDTLYDRTLHILSQAAQVARRLKESP